MIKQKILALKDFTLRTKAGKEYLLTQDQVAEVEFATDGEFQSLLTLGSFKEAPLSAMLQKPILVLHPPQSVKPSAEVKGMMQVETYVYLPPCDFECGIQKVIEFHRRSIKRE